MNLRIEMNLDNDAFQGGTRQQSIKTSIETALGKVDWRKIKNLSVGDVEKVAIMDINGNSVGHLLISP